ncbi:MAG TPA: Gfo/Idh/MocA family oxidoreductase [Streptosporangiaceae bacterium]|nr:Gfo/Idh/MocA family oxidoreductase [Streptosporangiaceae bacterium]
MSTIGSQPRPPIRIGVIGATPARGWGTAAHLPALQALGEFEVTAVATTRLTTARATAEVFGVPLAFADDAELVSSPAVDAVAIAVKVPEHDRLIRAAYGQPAVPDFATAVRYHQLLETIQRASDTGIRQEAVG